MLVDGDETLWSLQVDHQLFALSKLDLLVSSLHFIYESTPNITKMFNFQQ